jgi:hypothetical protein
MPHNPSHVSGTTSTPGHLASAAHNGTSVHPPGTFKPLPHREPHPQPPTDGPEGSTTDSSTACPATATARERPVRPWPLMLLAAPAAVAVWSGWVGIGRMTGFGQAHPLPGIWDSLHLDSAITLPIGVEAYAAYALRAWLSTSALVSARARRFARQSAITSLLLRMAGQVAYHLLNQAGIARAP